MEPERRYDLYVSLITACNITCAPAGLYYDEHFETVALSGPSISSDSGGYKLTLQIVEVTSSNIYKYILQAIFDYLASARGRVGDVDVLGALFSGSSLARFV